MTPIEAGTMAAVSYLVGWYARAFYAHVRGRALLAELEADPGSRGPITEEVLARARRPARRRRVAREPYRYRVSK